jgi:hypothetical protein
MDSRNGSREKAKAWISDRRNKALLVGVTVLVALVMLQVGNQRTPRSMAPLFGGCSLRNMDLQKMQVALSRAGLSDFEVAKGQLLVPEHQTSQYLQAISEQNALPAGLQEKSTSPSFANSLLTHSQQLALDRQHRKQKIQEMLMLLPFVEQAWFEMDEAVARAGFQPVEKSAVVTIQPKLDQPLLEQQVYTISQLICGAISGLVKERVVIVDLTTGFAHQGNVPSEGLEKRLLAQRSAFNRQQHLENRLREAFSRYPGLMVSVLIEADEQVDESQTASLEASKPGPVPPLNTPQLKAPRLKAPSVEPPVSQATHQQDSVLIGANGQVSLDPIGTKATAERPSVQNASCDQDAESTVRLTALHLPEPIDHLSMDHVTVIVDIPEQLLVSRFGNEARLRTQPSRIEDSQRERTRVLQGLVENLKPELDRTIQAVLSLQGLYEVPVVYNLIADQAAPVELAWTGVLRTAALKNWPSLGVLLIGLVLMALITTRGNNTARFRQADQVEEATTVRIATPNSAAEDESASVKAQLSQMIEKDPEAAARVIENWIRNAA